MGSYCPQLSEYEPPRTVPAAPQFVAWCSNAALDERRPLYVNGRTHKAARLTTMANHCQLASHVFMSQQGAPRTHAPPPRPLSAV